MVHCDLYTGRGWYATSFACGDQLLPSIGQMQPSIGDVPPALDLHQWRRDFFRLGHSKQPPAMYVEPMSSQYSVGQCTIILTICNGACRYYLPRWWRHGFWASHARGAHGTGRRDAQHRHGWAGMALAVGPRSRCWPPARRGVRLAVGSKRPKPRRTWSTLIHKRESPQFQRLPSNPKSAPDNQKPHRTGSVSRDLVAYGLPYAIGAVV